MNMETFYKEFNVINFLKCNTCKHWKKIEIGNSVSFKVYGDYDKRFSNDVDFDKEQIRVILTSNEGIKLKECPIIGMLSEEESKFMKDIIKNGWTNIFEGVICRVDKDAQYDQRISVAVYIEPNKM